MPAAYLIGGDGTVVWSGNPAALKDDLVETQLKELDEKHQVSTWSFMIAKSLPAIPAKLAGVEKLLEKKKFGGALKKVEGALPKLEGDDQQAGEQIRAWIEGVGTKGIEDGAAFVADGKIYKGFLEYEKIEEWFKGHDLAKQAKTAAKALASDKAQRPRDQGGREAREDQEGDGGRTEGRGQAQVPEAPPRQEVRRDAGRQGSRRAGRGPRVQDRQVATRRG